VASAGPDPSGTKTAAALPVGSKLIIVDTDPGIDDAMALLYLCAAPGVRLHSLSTVFGNADVETTSRNAAFLAARFGLDLPIYPGAAEPLQGQRHVPALKVHGADGLGGTGLARSVEVPRSAVPAWQHIADTISAYPGKVSLLAIGPLTNLALALRHRPQIAADVREVIVMGGAFGTRGRHGNIRPYAEANFFYDPLAAEEVLAAPWPVTVVGLDVSADCILSSAEAAAMATRFGKTGELLWAISRDYAEIYRKFDGLDGFCIHDVAAAARLVSPELFSVRRSAIGVEAVGEDAGRSFLSSDPKRPVQTFCDRVDAERLVAQFIEALTVFATRDLSSVRVRTP
jgi:inosine-uridine nucleoside N-ribohydrolase